MSADIWSYDELNDISLIIARPGRCRVCGLGSGTRMGVGRDTQVWCVIVDNNWDALPSSEFFDLPSRPHTTVNMAKWKRMMLVLRGGTVKQRKGHCSFFLLFWGLFRRRQTASEKTLLFVYIIVPGSPFLAPPFWWHYAHREWRQALIGWGLTQVSHVSQPRIYDYNCLMWHSDHRNRQKYCLLALDFR